ncbi:hypothetical protein IAU59_002599 [Kwoniella sp. CBS 9459]
MSDSSPLPQLQDLNPNPTTCLPEALRPQSQSHSSSEEQSGFPQASAPASSTSESSTSTFNANANANANAENSTNGGTDDRPTSSIFSRSDAAPVHNVPMRVIRRPLPSELDENKVLTFMEEMKGGDTFTPIELVKVKSPLKSNPSGPSEVFYFAMGGCHRYEATKRLGLETIRARIIEVPASQMRVYLGAGSPF